MKIKNSTKYVQHFSKSAIDVNKNRSNFYRPSVHSTTFKTGDIVPIYADEVLPGSTRTIDVASVVRGATPLFPVMDNAYIDTTAFFIPNRLVFDHWEQFMGENKDDAWTNSQEFLIPHLSFKDTLPDECKKGTPIDYMGLVGDSTYYNPDYSETRTFNALYPRAYCKVWNDWFRNQNLQEPCHIYTDDIDRDIYENVIGDGDGFYSDYVSYGEYGVECLRVNKFKDYFTSALPQPQKHAPITLPLGGFAPVVENEEPSVNDLTALSMYTRVGNNAVYPIENTVGAILSSGMLMTGAPTSQSADSRNVYTSLQADLSQATAVTINQLRLAIKTQKFYETQARGGSRYTEILLSMFGVYAQDSRLQRAEFLGGKRMNIRQTQVNQTTADGLGNTGAYSLTTGNEHIFSHSFSEHGILLILAYVRTDQTYYQGQEKIYARRELFDYYFPVFALLGEQPIRNKEIFYTGSEQSEDVFGYQEAYAEYRYKPNRVSGELKPRGAYGAYTYANDFDEMPYLTSEFALQDDNAVKRTLAVQDDTQWIGSFYFEEKKAEVMPVYSVPSITDFF